MTAPADNLLPRVDSMFTEQLATWHDADERYRRMRHAMKRSLSLPGGTFELIHLPDRAVSTCARTDSRSIAERPCFLCEANRHAAQLRLPLEGSGLEILINPFPIYDRHLTIPSLRHTPQAYSKHLLEQMLAIAHGLKEYTVFYNGPHSGASAPDHLHLQAVNTTEMPQILLSTTDSDCRILKSDGDTRLYFHPSLTTRPVTVSGTDFGKMADMMGNALSLLPVHPGETEPRLNLYATPIPGSDKTALTAILRDCHRPTCYGDDGVIFSPGAIDMGGRIVLPRKSDLDSLTADKLQSMLSEVLLPEETYNRFILDCISHPL